MELSFKNLMEPLKDKHVADKLYSSTPLSKKNFIHEHDLNEINERYKMFGPMDSGSFGVVYRALDTQYNVPCAIKLIRFPDQAIGDQTEIDAYLLEFRLLRDLDHPNILRLIEVFKNEEKLCLVTEICKGENLAEVLNKPENNYSEQEVAFIIWQLLLAVNYCHKHDICHRDIKLDNILLDQ